MINKVILIGNAGSAPEIKVLENNTVGKFSLATNENYKDKSGEWQTKTEWHRIVLWGNLTKLKIEKGQLLYVEGKLSTSKWQDKDGNDRYTTEVVAYTIRRLQRNEAAENAQDRSESESTSVDTGDDLPF